MIPYGWEGSRRSGVAVAMCHRLKWWLIRLMAQDVRKEGKYPANTFLLAVALLVSICCYMLYQNEASSLFGDIRISLYTQCESSQKKFVCQK